jgi:hypothetical protein
VGLVASDPGNDPNTEDFFGSSVAIGEDWVVVGAPADGVGGVETGAVYIFRWIAANTWDGGVKLVSADPDADDFFCHVSTDGDYIVVGASGEDAGGDRAGAAYVYMR